MYIVASYDVSDDRVREKIKRSLWKYGFSPIARSVYIGKLGTGELSKLTEIISRKINEKDIVIFIPIQNRDAKRIIFIQKGEVWTNLKERGVIVIGEDY